MRRFERGGRGSDGEPRPVWVIPIGVLIVQAAFNCVRVHQPALAGEGVVTDLRKTVFDRVLRFPVPFFDPNLTGDILSRLRSDAAAVQYTVSSALPQVLLQSITLIGGVVVLVLISPVLSLTVLSSLAFVIIGGAMFGRLLRVISTDFRDRISEANSLARNRSCRSGW